MSFDSKTPPSEQETAAYIYDKFVSEPLRDLYFNPHLTHIDVQFDGVYVDKFTLQFIQQRLNEQHWQIRMGTSRIRTWPTAKGGKRTKQMIFKEIQVLRIIRHSVTDKKVLNGVINSSDDSDSDYDSSSE